MGLESCPVLSTYSYRLQELYRAAYSEPLAADGSMFRGTPPTLWRTDPNPGECSCTFVFCGYRWLAVAPLCAI